VPLAANAALANQLPRTVTVGCESQSAGLQLPQTVTVH
jgi:hypothetical protein